MLRVNQSFLEFTENLYHHQERKEDLILKEYAAGERLLVQNEPASKVLLIKEGITKCYVSEKNDKQYILEFLGKGQIVGEIECIKNLPCLCNVEAMSRVSVYAFSIPFFRELLSNNIDMNGLLVDVFAERLINTSSRASFQQLYTLEHSIRRLLKIQSTYDLNLSKEDLAAYLGISVRSYNRSLKKIVE
jgi:CRP-like cAMP-binding protein